MLAVFAFALFSFAARLRLNERPWGDEPHYLIMSIALGKYHTFDLTKAYANRDYWSFYPQEIDAHVFPSADGTMVPLHNFGGPLLWTIPFTIWGRAGAAAVMVLLSVLIVVNVYHLLRELGIVKFYAGLVTALFVVGTPIYMYASMQFIEPIGALVVIYSVRTLVNPAPSATRVALTSAGLGYLPWVHGRFTIFTVIIAVLLVLQVGAREGRRAVRSYLPAVLPLAIFILALELFNFTKYGSLSPAPGNANLGDGLLQIGPHVGLSSQLFDRQFGLLSHFPILALAVPGFFLARQRGLLPTHLVILGVIAPYVLAISTFKTWWAGFSPPARLLAVVTPLLAYYVAVTLQRLHSWFSTTLAMLAAIGAFIVAVAGDIFTVARFTESGGAGVDPLLDYLGDVLHIGRFAYLFPTNRLPGDNPAGFIFWFLVLAGFTTAVWLAGRNLPAERIPLTAMASLFPERWEAPGRSRRGTGDPPGVPDRQPSAPDDRPAAPDDRPAAPDNQPAAPDEPKIITS